MQETALSGGFSDAPIEAAIAFRAAMSAMARPGLIARIGGARPPAPLSVAAGTLVLTLCDPETPLHLAGDHDRREIRDWIAFHAGAPVVSRERAAFAVGTWEALLPLRGYRIGLPEYPDRSATLIVERKALSDRTATIAGPGLRDASTMDLPETEAFRANARHFPLGLDFFFTAGDQVAALPRTTKVSA
jgi:alpha-D-ribose 1-methylphosphonate 5-triphosphate synthase subunit PhnH